MTKPIIDLLETVEIADQHGDRSIGTLAASDFTVQMQKQRARIGKSSQVIGSGGVFREPVFQGILNREPKF